ncbi:MAG: polymer-forming cytoskeletal protein [Anaerolineae bacterium]
MSSEGDTQSQQPSGIWNGDLRITGPMDVHGIVNGSVFVESGAVVKLHGTVNGTVHNLGGDLTICGIVNGPILRHAGTTVLMPGAIVNE